MPTREEMEYWGRVNTGYVNDAASEEFGADSYISDADYVSDHAPNQAGFGGGFGYGGGFSGAYGGYGGYGPGVQVTNPGQQWSTSYLGLQGNGRGRGGHQRGGRGRGDRGRGYGGRRGRGGLARGAFTGSGLVNPFENPGPVDQGQGNGDRGGRGGGGRGRGGRGRGDRGRGDRGRGDRGRGGRGGFTGMVNPFENPGQGHQQGNQGQGGHGHDGRGGSVPVQEGSRKRQYHETDESNKRFALAMLKPAASDHRYVRGGVNVQVHQGSGAVTSARLAAGDPDAVNWYADIHGAAPGAYGNLSYAKPLSGGKISSQQKDSLMAMIGAQQSAARLSSSGLTWSTHQPVQTSLAPKANLSNSNLGAGPSMTAGMSALAFHRQNRAHSQATKSIMGGDTAQATAAGSSEGNPINLVGKEPERITIRDSPEPAPRMCDNCKQDGTHSTGECAIITSKEGDCMVDPFCNCTTKEALDRNGKPSHTLQGKQRPHLGGLQISCPKLLNAWQNDQLHLIFTKLVVERRRKAPLLVYSWDFCFIKLTLDYSVRFCERDMPGSMEGIWPYTQADAIKYQEELKSFHHIGLESMPKGELEGLSLSLIYRFYQSGDLQPQFRHLGRNWQGPKALTFAQDNVKDKGKEADKSAAPDRDGDAQMQGDDIRNVEKDAEAEGMRGTLPPPPPPKPQAGATSAQDGDDLEAEGMRGTLPLPPPPKPQAGATSAQDGGDAEAEGMRGTLPPPPPPKPQAGATQALDEDDAEMAGMAGVMPGAPIPSERFAESFGNLVAMENGKEIDVSGQKGYGFFDMAETGSDVPKGIWDAWQESVNAGLVPNRESLLRRIHDVLLRGITDGSSLIHKIHLKQWLEAMANEDRLPAGLKAAVEGQPRWD